MDGFLDIIGHIAIQLLKSYFAPGNPKVFWFFLTPCKPFFTPSTWALVFSIRGAAARFFAAKPITLSLMEDKSFSGIFAALGAGFAPLPIKLFNLVAMLILFLVYLNGAFNKTFLLNFLLTLC
mgnify:CR=1 FL=1